MRPTYIIGGDWWSMIPAIRADKLFPNAISGPPARMQAFADHAVIIADAAQQIH